jgi:hypothetical protein
MGAWSRSAKNNASTIWSGICMHRKTRVLMSEVKKALSCASRTKFLSPTHSIGVMRFHRWKIRTNEKISG